MIPGVEPVALYFLMIRKKMVCAFPINQRTLAQLDGDVLRCTVGQEKMARRCVSLKCILSVNTIITVAIE